MARDRQKAKQRKAKREAQQQKNQQRAAEKAKRSEHREERLEEIEQEGTGRQAMAHTGIASEVELDQARMDADLQKAAEQEAAGDGAPAKGDTVEAAPHVQETKRQRRQRERAEQKTREASKKTSRGRRGDGGGQQKQGKQAKQGKPPREHGRVRNFFKQVWAEMKRVQWPTRDQVLQATGVVAGFCLIAGLYLAFWDYVWNKAVEALF